MVGLLSGTDPDEGESETLTFALVDGYGDNTSFVIEANELKTAEGFDYETKSSYDIQVRAVDTGSPQQYCDRQFTIEVGDVLGSGSVRGTKWNDLNQDGLQGDGFRDPVHYSVGGGPHAALLAKLNADEHYDLVTADYDGHSVTVRLGNGEGAFGDPATYSSGFARPIGAAVGQANSDSDTSLDVLIVDRDSDSVVVMLGSDDGSLTQLTPKHIDGGPLSLAVGYFDDDDRIDLVVGLEGSNGITILLGQGDGTFGVQSAPYLTGSDPYSIAVSDFDGDGHLDLAVVNADEDSVTVLLGDGGGAFVVQDPKVSVGDYPWHVSTGDFDEDGNEDLAVALYSDGKISVLRGDGDGAFAAFPGQARDLPAGAHPRSVMVADLNHDGHQDLVFPIDNGSGTDQVGRLLGNGDGTFGVDPAQSLPVENGTRMQCVVPGDLNGDGLPDLVALNYQGSKASVLLNDGIEDGLEGWIIYTDLNGNGALDAHEQSDVTDADGLYEISGLEPGTYIVAEVAKPLWWRTHPGEAGTHTAEVDHEQVTEGLNFGSVWGRSEEGGTLLSLSWDAQSRSLKVDMPACVDGASNGQSLSDLAWWHGNSALDAANNKLHVLGGAESGTYRLYTMDLATGDCTDQALDLPAGLLHELVLAGMYEDKIIALGWSTSGGQEHVLEVDPATGNVTSVGTVGDMTWWHRQAVLDEASDKLYVAGSADGTVYKLYTYDLATDTVTSQPALAEGELIFAGLDSTGKIVGLRWNGSAEEVYKIAPVTGAMGSPIGTVSDLASWHGRAVVDTSTDTLYVSGLPTDGTHKLYTMDLSTGSVTDEQAMPDGSGEFLNHFMQQSAGGGATQGASVTSFGAPVTQLTTTVDEDAEPSDAEEFLAIVPAVRIKSAHLFERDLGEIALAFGIGLSPPSHDPVTVEYGVWSSGSRDGGDSAVVLTFGTVIFEPGEREQDIVIDVPVKWDVGSPAVLYVVLSNPANAVLAEFESVSEVAFVNDPFLASASS